MKFRNSLRSSLKSALITRSQHAASKQVIHLRLDSLEERLQPAINSYMTSEGSLVIMGTELNDQIVLTTSIHAGTPSLEVQGSYGSVPYSAWFPLANFKYPGVKFYGKAGDDYFINLVGFYSEAYGSSGNDTLFGGANIDYLSGGDGDDYLNGFGESDKIIGGTGNDSIYGSDGDDALFGQQGRDSIFGEFGNDEIHGDSDSDLIYGGDGDDELHGGSGTDMISGGNGNDVIHGGTGADLIDGVTGHDEIYGGSGDDSLYGGDGNDTVSGQGGRDTVYAGDGNDIVYGGDNADYLYGESGNDSLSGNKGGDRLYGGLGVDSLSGGSGNDGLFAGFQNNETLFGGAGDDRFLRWQSRGIIQDPTGRDAQMMFVNGDQSWDEDEIELADEAFHRIQIVERFRALRDPVINSPLEFVNGSLKAGALGDNHAPPQVSFHFNWPELRWDVDVSFDRTITIADWDPNDPSEAINTFIHEVGHNWDPAVTAEDYEKFRDDYDNILQGGIFVWPAISKALTPYYSTRVWKSFLSTSSWLYKPLSTYNHLQGSFDGEYSNWYYGESLAGSFLDGGYGALNPYEDWATAFAERIMQNFGDTDSIFQAATGNTKRLLQKKLDLIDARFG